MLAYLIYAQIPYKARLSLFENHYKEMYKKPKLTRDEKRLLRKIYRKASKKRLSVKHYICQQESKKEFKRIKKGDLFILNSHGSTYLIEAISFPKRKKLITGVLSDRVVYSSRNVEFRIIKHMDLSLFSRKLNGKKGFYWEKDTIVLTDLETYQFTYKYNGEFINKDCLEQHINTLKDTKRLHSCYREQTIKDFSPSWDKAINRFEKSNASKEG